MREDAKKQRLHQRKVDAAVFLHSRYRQKSQTRAQAALQAGLLTCAYGKMPAGLLSLPGCPVTDFRQKQTLRAYSGGSVRDLHPISYSPP
jgi:hypothetical protein